MAFNLATFKTRALSAVFFVLVMVAGIIWNQWSFFILFSIIHFGCWHEYQKLVSSIDKGYAGITGFHRYGVMIAGWCTMWWFMNEGGWAALLPGFGVLYVLLPLADALTTKRINWRNIAHSTFGFVYISLSLSMLVDLYGETFSVSNEGVPFAKEPFALVGARYACFVPAFIIACMWINDTMAYIVGSLIGRTPFSKISPKKTWEGTIGGIILCVAVAGYFGALINRPEASIQIHIPSYHWYIIAGIAAVAGTVGDLLESKLKRLAGVKDSGSIMPGHGGFLDRFDSLLVATPFVWLYLAIML